MQVGHTLDRRWRALRRVLRRAPGRVHFGMTGKIRRKGKERGKRIRKNRKIENELFVFYKL
jgi:hypothetical protein